MVEVEPEKVEDAEFKWGKKKGIGGKKKRVQFYESFTYDGVEYVLFDSVYLYKEGEPEPYIGKLLKIWEHPDKMRKVKVLWFFRPCEILNFLGDEEPSDNELFLASGEGVGLCNVNPLDIVWHGFGERCTAKMIQRIVFSSPHSGQAFVIFSKREVAEMVVRKLDESCLLLSDGRPLVGSLGTPCFPEKKLKFFGHFGIDKRRYQMQREEKDAVSTSHCSQPNTLEFEMALEWCLLQEKSELSWKKLYQKQGQELKQLKAKLKARWR